MLHSNSTIGSYKSKLLIILLIQGFTEHKNPREKVELPTLRNNNHKTMHSIQNEIYIYNLQRTETNLIIDATVWSIQCSSYDRNHELLSQFNFF